MQAKLESNIFLNELASPTGDAASVTESLMHVWDDICW